jgi:hypothetical protein
VRVIRFPLHGSPDFFHSALCAHGIHETLRQGDLQSAGLKHRAFCPAQQKAAAATSIAAAAFLFHQTGIAEP